MPLGNVDGAMQIGEWLLTPSFDSISRGTETHKLEPRTTRLLLCLAKSAPEVVSVERLLTEVWSGVVVGSASVYQAVSQLRKLLGDTDPDPTYIATVPRRGYRLIAVVRRVEALNELAQSTPAVSPAAPVFTPPAHERKLLLIVVATLIAAIVAGAFIWIRTTSAELAASAKSVAVLPFVDMSEGKDQEYFADGLSEELIEQLSNISDLRVPARTSSFYFKGKSEDIATIAKTLHVTHVLEGSVRKSGKHLRVTAQLIGADGGYHLWSENFDRELNDVFSVQDEIASAVVAALKLKLVHVQPAFSTRTSSIEAYNQYLLGRQFNNQALNAEDFQRAVEAFGKSIALDPNYAAAYAGLANSQAQLADFTGDAAALRQAEANVEKAIALAPQGAYGYAVRGDLRANFSWDWPGAQADLAKALLLDPADVKVRSRYGNLMEYLGRLPDAILALKKAIELDPLSNGLWNNLGRYLMFSRDYPAAGEALRRALEIQPNGTSVLLMNLATLQLLEGKVAEALTTFQKVQDDGLRLSGISMAEQSLGHAEESQQALDELIAKDAQDSAYQIAEAYAWRREKDKAFAWLERAYRQRDGGLAEVKVDPLLEGLYSDPRYKALLRKMNLPE